MENKLKKIIELHYPEANSDQTRNIVSDLQLDIDILYCEAEKSYFMNRKTPEDVSRFLKFFKITLDKELLRCPC